MPTVSIEYLHEIIYGCNQMVHAANQGKFRSVHVYKQLAYASAAQYRDLQILVHGEE